LARKFPKTNFILGHMGFGPSDREAMEACQELDNLFLETSCGNYLFIEQVVNRAGADKVIFGSEFPLSHPGAELRKILLLDISDDEREKILGRNMLALIGFASRKG
jgi:predicted TIM-barrel fold metal-dependent hydrolase